VLLQAQEVAANNPLLWVLWSVLAGVGVFLMRVGLRLVDSVQNNTTAVVALTGKIEKLCEQQSIANATIQAQMSSHLETLKGEFRRVIDEVRRTSGDGDRDNPR
jgi:hypothetical protein